MNTPTALACLIIIAGAALTGCAADTQRYPSFAIPQTSGERVRGTLTPGAGIDIPDPAAATAPLPADLDARVAALAALGEDAQRAFAQASSEAQRLVEAARGADAQSERWMRAQVALADLTAHRSRTRTALADIDQIAASADVTALDDPAAARIAATQSRLADYAAQQSQRLAQLHSILEL